MYFSLYLTDFSQHFNIKAFFNLSGLFQYTCLVYEYFSRVKLEIMVIFALRFIATKIVVISNYKESEEVNNFLKLFGSKLMFKALLISAVSLMALEANAIRLQILHTNDTHAYLDKSTHQVNRGGSARLKALMDYYEDKAKDDGVITLRVDAGDFSEGNMYYLANRARSVFSIHGTEMEYDVGILGNHDYLMGTSELNDILSDVDLSMNLTTANIKVPARFKAIREKIKPFVEYKVGDLKFAFMGLTTNEIFYTWRLYQGQVTSPKKEAKKLERVLKERGNDFVFAVTHIGVLKDMSLAKSTSFIDAIVGGHSHTALYEPRYVKNKLKKNVPIVQAGKHMEYLGRFIVDLEKGQPLKVVSYELVPVKYEMSDSGVQRKVAEADHDLNGQYGEEWLNAVVGKTDLKPDDRKGSKKWAGFIADTMREVSNSDIAIQVSSMNGENFPVGEVTRRDLYNSMPRTFDMDEKYGWSVYTTEIKGYWIKILFEVLLKFGQPLNFSGVEMKTVKTVFGLKVKDVVINGQAVRPMKNYTVAFNEGIVRGALGIGKATLAILQKPKKTPHLIWESLEKRMQDKNTSLSKMDTDKNKTYFNPDDYLTMDGEDI